MLRALHRAVASQSARRSLRSTLLITLTLALTPVLLLAALQAQAQLENNKRQRGETLLAISDDMVQRIDGQLGRVEALLAAFSVPVSDGECRAVFDQADPIVPQIANVVFVDPQGRVSCSAQPEPAYGFASSEGFAAIREGATTAWSDAQTAGDDGQALLAVLRRVETDGQFLGAAAFSIDAGALLTAQLPTMPSDTVEIALADPDGMLFGSDRFEQLDPAGLEIPQGRRRAIVSTEVAANGDNMDLVIRPLRGKGLVAVVSGPAPSAFSATSLTPALMIGLPLLLFAVALGAVWVAVDWLVLRWLRSLKRLARAYGDGFYDFKPRQFERAPEEIADFAVGLERMADKISDRDGTLRAALSARDAAVREIHHRIKNNLQIVTSFVSLQGRGVKDPNAAQLLRDVRYRIDALSIVHQTLYRHERLDSVRMDVFLGALLDHLSDSLGMEDASVGLHWEIDDVERSADVAIPIALFVLETITNSMKYAFTPDGGTIEVRLRSEDGALRLTVTDDGCGMPSTAEGTPEEGLGGRLMSAFARQLGGTMERGRGKNGGGCHVALSMPDRQTVPTFDRTSAPRDARPPSSASAVKEPTRC